MILKDSTTIKFFSCEKEFFSCVFKGDPFLKLSTHFQKTQALGMLLASNVLLVGDNVVELDRT